MGLFSSKCIEGEGNDKPQVQTNEHDKAVLKLKVTRDKVSKFKKKIDADIEQAENQARQLLREKKKDRALLVLKRKKFLEKEYMTADAELNNVKQLLSTMEFSKIQNDVLASLDGGNKALQAMQKVMSLEDAERIMDETAEGVQWAEDLSDLLGEGLSAEDNELLEQQLSALTAEVNGPEPEVPVMPVVPDVPIMPVVPDHPVPQPEEEATNAREAEDAMMAI